MKTFTVEFLDEKGKSQKHGNYKHILTSEEANTPKEAINKVKLKYKEFCAGMNWIYEEPNLKVWPEEDLYDSLRVDDFNNK